MLKKGTRLQTSGEDVELSEYCHWTFPDDDASSQEVSYMMARRLKPPSERRPVCARNEVARSVLEKTRALLVRDRPTIVPSPSRMPLVERLERERAAGGAAAAAPPYLYNKVVTIDGESSDWKYWFVLTYLPDLQWCHVVPLEQRGVFEAARLPADKKASAGRARWMTVSEDEGGSIDVGAARCHVVPVVEVKADTTDADEEEWDILDG